MNIQILEVVTRISDLKYVLKTLRGANNTVGLVPTMGALHEGHLRLVRQAKMENSVVVVSIFVNPTQFNNPEDLEKYPRNLSADLALLEKENVDFVFAPGNQEMYPSQMHTSISFPGLDQVLEGAFRPGHFNGVAIVISKLFHIIEPDVAYFGQKDLQQVSVIKRLVQDLHFGLDIRVVPTVRNPDGLALSSRNERLTPHQRSQALILSLTLKQAENDLRSGMEWNKVKEAIMPNFGPTADVQLEYLELVDTDTFEILTKSQANRNQALCIAAYVGGVRLIDNVILS